MVGSAADRMNAPAPGWPAATSKDPGFASTLREAIRASGLTLDRLQYRLRQRGVPVTVTSLSYWQSGRRRPERPESITALTHLEVVLGLPTGSLLGLLGPPRPRGRRPECTRSTPLEALWRDQKLITPLLSGMPATTNTGMKMLSLHDRVEIVDRCQLRTRVRQIAQAERDGIDRWVSIYDMQSPGQLLPRIVPIRSCRPGRVAQNRNAGVLVTEWLFDQPMSRGDTLIMEFELVHTGPRRDRSSDTFTRLIRQPVRQYIVELQFHPNSLPAFCRQYETQPPGNNSTQPRDLRVSRSGHVHTIRLNTTPCANSLVWGWSTD